MDPNTNLMEQERLVLALGTDASRRDYRRFARHTSIHLAELRDALTEWIRNGGFEPDWSAAPNARIYYGR